MNPSYSVGFPSQSEMLGPEFARLVTPALKPDPFGKIPPRCWRSSMASKIFSALTGSPTKYSAAMQRIASSGKTRSRERTRLIPRDVGLPRNARVRTSCPLFFCSRGSPSAGGRASGRLAWLGDEVAGRPHSLNYATPLLRSRRGAEKGFARLNTRQDAGMRSATF